MLCFFLSVVVLNRGVLSTGPQVWSRHGVRHTPCMVYRCKQRDVAATQRGCLRALGVIVVFIIIRESGLGFVCVEQVLLFVCVRMQVAHFLLLLVLFHPQ